MLHGIPPPARYPLSSKHQHLVRPGRPVGQLAERSPPGPVRKLTIGNATRHGVEVGVCGTCMDARGLRDDELIEGARRGTMAQLAQWTADADKVLVF